MTHGLGDDTTQGQTPSACEVPTTTSGQSSVRSGSDDGGENGSNSDDTDDGDLQANRFGLDLHAGDIDDLLDIDAAEIDALLDAESVDIGDLLDEVCLDPDELDSLLETEILSDDELQELLDEQADLYAEQVARQWGTPEGEWWP